MYRRSLAPRPFLAVSDDAYSVLGSSASSGSNSTPECRWKMNTSQWSCGGVIRLMPLLSVVPYTRHKIALVLSRMKSPNDCFKGPSGHSQHFWSSISRGPSID